MLPPDPTHPTIRAAFEAAALPAGATFFPASDADGVLPTGGITTPYELPRIERLLPAADAAEVAISLGAHVARGEVVAALVHHAPVPDPLGLPPSHRLEIRLARIEHRDSVWRHLARRGLCGLRWLVPPCRIDIWKYAVVQSPIAHRDWPGIVERANAERCSHLVILGDELSHGSALGFHPGVGFNGVGLTGVGFSGTCEYVAVRCSGSADTCPPPVWLESAAVAFRAEHDALERQTLSLLFGSGLDTTVVRNVRAGFLRRRDRSWQVAPHLELEGDDRCLVSPGPFASSHKIVVVHPGERRIAFHDPLPSPRAEGQRARVRESRWPT